MGDALPVRQPANADSHYRGTGPEILADLPTITHFVAGLGTTGTLMGAGRFLREHVQTSRSSQQNRAMASWSTGCAISTKASCQSSTTSRCSRRVTRSVPETPSGARVSCSTKRESSLAFRPGQSFMPLSESRQKAVKAGERADIAFIVCDGGWKYLSTGVYDAESLDAAEAAIEGQLWA